MGASNFSYAVTLTVRSVPVMVPVVYGCSLTFVLSCYIALSCLMTHVTYVSSPFPMPRWQCAMPMAVSVKLLLKL